MKIQFLYFTPNIKVFSDLCKTSVAAEEGAFEAGLVWNEELRKVVSYPYLCGLFYQTLS